jgi:rod shape determining protein RodA
VISLNQLKESYFDFNLVFVIFLIMLSSLLTINSADTQQYDDNFLLKQALWFSLSIVLVVITFSFDFDQIKSLTIYIYGFGIILLVTLLASPASIAPEINGAKSWFVLPGIGSIQPSEYMKIFIILMLSKVTETHSEKYTMGNIRSDFFYLFKVSLISGLPMFLVLLQNDFGSTLVIFVLSCFIIFVSGVNWKIIVTILSLVLIAVSSLVLTFLYKTSWLLFIMDDYQLNRIYAWLDPFKYGSDISYQLKQSILAIGSGGTGGKGYGDGVVYIPEAHSDFIFSIVGEEFGFIGSSFIICLYFIIIYRIVTLGVSQKKHPFQLFICVGMTGLLTFHVFQNIGMVIGLLPITGIPLPLMSYGGSSVLATMFGLGIILNISLKKKKFMFSDEEN